jgi:Cys-tRNA(Pro) deacylase
MTLEERIIQALKENQISYEEIEHVPVYTNPTMAEALNVSEAETVKSLVLATKENKLIVLVLPGDKKVNWKITAEAAKTKKVSFAKPEVVKDAVGCEVGCVPPFGHIMPLPVYMDQDLTKTEYVYFNPGVHHKSIRIRSWDLKKLCNPAMVKA